VIGSYWAFGFSIRVVLTLICLSSLAVNVFLWKKWKKLSEQSRSQQSLNTSQTHEISRLKEEIQNYRMMFQSLPIGIFRTNEHGECTFINNRWQSISQIDIHEIAHAKWYDGIHHEEKQQAIDRWQKSVQQGMPFSGTFRLKDAKNKSRWANISINPVNLEFGTVFFGALEDITESKMAEEELRDQAQVLQAAKEKEKQNSIKLINLVSDLKRAKTQAQTAAKAKSEFLANMSHEIRTPMTAILGYTDILVEQHQEENRSTEILEIVQRNGEFLLQIINDILDVSKIEAGEMSVEKIESRPQELISEIISLMSLRAQEKNIQLEVEHENAIPELIRTDPFRLRQILTNLINNAIKFTSEGSVKLQVSYEANLSDSNDNSSPEPGQILFKVVDTGIGMTEEQLENLYKPFTQADESTTRKYGGTGLGLTISKRLANMLGGDLTATSTYGAGTTFTLSLETENFTPEELFDITTDNPQEESESAEKTIQPGGSTFSACTETTPSIRLLLAEDGKDNQRLISFILKKAGMQVKVVENGQEAFELAMEQFQAGEPFDAILMDMQMPILDGYDATRQLREQEYPGAVIALTAHAMTGDRQKCLDAGCNDFATKPIDREALTSAIHKNVAALKNATMI